MTLTKKAPMVSLSPGFFEPEEVEPLAMLLAVVLMDPTRRAAQRPEQHFAAQQKLPRPLRPQLPRGILLEEVEPLAKLLAVELMDPTWRAAQRPEQHFAVPLRPPLPLPAPDR